MTITFGQILSLAGAIGNALTEAGVLDAAGNFTSNPTPAQLGKAAASIETLLKARGLDVPKNVDKVIQLLPVILAF